MGGKDGSLGASLHPVVALFDINLSGANSEPCFMGGAICAERSALVQLRLLPYKRIVRIYIVSDADWVLSPGMLCRCVWDESHYIIIKIVLTPFPHPSITTTTTTTTESTSCQ